MQVHSERLQVLSERKTEDKVTKTEFKYGRTETNIKSYMFRYAKAEFKYA